MEKKIIILGKIGNTEFQNNDRCKVLYGGGITKAIYADVCRGNAPLVVRRWKKK